MKRLPAIRQYLLCGLLATLPFERIPSLEVYGVTLRISQLIGLLLIAASLPLLWKRREQLTRSPWVWLVAFNLIALISAVVSAHPGHSIKIALFVAYVSVLAWTISLVLERKRLATYLKWGLGGVVASCIFGVYQFFGDLGGLSNSLTGLRPQYMKGGIFPFPRIQSTALEPLYFADYLLAPFAILIALQLYGKRRVWPLTLLVAAVITLSLSRGAQIAAIGIVLIFSVIGVLLHRYRRTLEAIGVSALAIAISLGLIALGSYLYPQYNGRHNTAEGSIRDFTHQATNVNQGESAIGRGVTRHLALEAGKEQPVIGVGPGNFGSYAHLHDPAKFPTSETIVNNETLEIFAEEGLLGLIAIGLFVGGFGLQAVQAIRANQNKAVSVAITALLVGLLAIFVQYQLFSTLYITHIWVAVGLLIGLTAAAPAKTTKKGSAA